MVVPRSSRSTASTRRIHRVGLTRYVSLAFLLVLAIWPFTQVRSLGAATAPTTNPIDVVIVLDESGSMVTCWPWSGGAPPLRPANCPPGKNPPSDPKDRRYSAARLLVQLADSDDRIAVIRFDSKVEGVGGGQLRVVGDPASRAAFTAELQPPTDDYSGRGQTRIDLGLQRAAKILQDRSEKERPGYILFLTDGEPNGGSNQIGSVNGTMRSLERQGIVVYPVALCGGSCPPNMVNILTPMGNIRQATTAGELLEAFSSSFADMKPQLNVVKRDSSGTVKFIVRDWHGAYELNAVVTKDASASLQRGGVDAGAQLAWEDGNIALHRGDRASIQPGEWTLQTSDSYGFVVARTETYPRVIFPRSAGGEQGIRLVPAHKQVVVVAKAEGAPGASNELSLDGSKLEQPSSGLFWTKLPEMAGDKTLTIQVGADTTPLLIKRDFHFKPVDGLPQAQASPPSGCAAGEPCPLVASFTPGGNAPLTQLGGTVYVLDGKDGKVISTEPLKCDDSKRECRNDTLFHPENGRSYHIRYLMEAHSGDQLYSDWADADFSMEPAVFITGLPDTLNLKEQPQEGWPIEVKVGTDESLGQLTAKLSLAQPGGAGAIDVPVDLGSIEARPGAAQSAKVHILLNSLGQSDLKPGISYTGNLIFSVEKAGKAKIVPGSVPVVYALGKLTATVLDSQVSFEDVTFDPSAGFSVNLAGGVKIRFPEAVFPIAADVTSENCPYLNVGIAKQVEGTAAGEYVLALYARSQGSVSAGDCTGKITFKGDPAESYDVRAGELKWFVKVRPLEWDLVGAIRDGKRVASLDFDQVTYTGEQARGELLVRYTGKLPPGGEGSPPFTVKHSDILGLAEDGSQISDKDMELQVGPVPNTPDADGNYHVPVLIKARHDIAHHWWNGALYTGKVGLSVEQLPDKGEKPISFSVRSPGWVQRNLMPPLNFVYGFWLLPPFLPFFCTLPFTIFALLVTRAMIRNARQRIPPPIQPGNGGPIVPQQPDAPVPPPPWKVPGPATTGQTGWGQGAGGARRSGGGWGSSANGQPTSQSSPSSRAAWPTSGAQSPSSGWGSSPAQPSGWGSTSPRAGQPASGGRASTNGPSPWGKGPVGGKGQGQGGESGWGRRGNSPGD
ncbi:MAG TPA: vWA domain-containing protein [Chloroflexia bacterium]|nr:vWA domain-containing protein [Chloroflexia bacterium]